jgi:TPR repeat protein
MSKLPTGRFSAQIRLRKSRLFGYALLLSAVCCNFAMAAGETEAAADDIDLVEIVRKPEIGNYRGYAEFKMAHYATARRIWEALDERNFGEAAFNLGLLYEDGLGVEKNIDRALSYYRRGAANGSAKAVFRVGIVYWLGTPDIPKNEIEGRRYLSLAAAGGDQEAARYLKEAASPGSATSDAVIGADRAMAEGRPADAIRLLTEAADAGVARAQTRLAWHYETGRAVERNLEKAAYWFQRAAQGGDGEAMYALSVMLATGAGQVRNPALAESWLQKSAGTGYPSAVNDLRARY